jgi:hypothetical protein
MREEAVAGQTEPQYRSVRKQNTHATKNIHSAPLSAQQRTIATPSKQSHVPDRGSCRVIACHDELSRRPCPCCTVVHIHNIKRSTNCSGAHERGSSRRANKTKYCSTRKTKNTHESIKATSQHPLSAQQRTSILTPSEQSHVPDRCSCKTIAHHAELSRRPCPCCTVVHIHGIRTKRTICSGEWRA